MEARPSIFDFTTIGSFVGAMVAWRKQEEQDFSFRSFAAAHGLSHTLISRVISGKRRLTPDKIASFTKLLNLNGQEKTYLERWVSRERQGASKDEHGKPREPKKGTRPRRVTNHLLEDWLNVYVRDACHLEGFDPNGEALAKLLGDIASVKHLERSAKFLLAEGYIRKTLEGRYVLEDPLVTTSDGLPSAKIRAFHRQALRLASRNLELVSLKDRSEHAVVMHLKEDDIPKVKELMQEFYERLLQFAEERPAGHERLVQVLLNLTPISTRRNGESNS